MGVVLCCGLSFAEDTVDTTNRYFSQLERDLGSFSELNTKVINTYQNGKNKDLRDFTYDLEQLSEQIKSLRWQISYNKSPIEDKNLNDFQEHLITAVQNNAEGISNYVNNLRQNDKDESNAVSFLMNSNEEINKALVALKANPTKEIISVKRANCDVFLTVQNKRIRELDAALKKYRHTALKTINFKPIESCLIDDITHKFHMDSPVQDDNYLQEKGHRYEESLVVSVREKLRAIARKIMGSIGLRLEMEGLIDKQLAEERFIKDPPGYLNKLIRQINATKNLEAEDRVRMQKALHEALKQIEALDQELKMLSKLKSEP